MTTPDSTTSPGGEPHEADLPGFSPSRRDKLDPIDPERTTVTVDPSSTSSPSPSSSPPTYDPSRPLDEQVGDELGDEEWLEHLDPRNRPSSSRGSTEPDPVVAGALEQLAKLGVTFASLALNRTIGRGNEAWLIHEDEAIAIAAPLGRIGARHAPVGDGVAGDVADGIDAGLATAGYAMRAAADHTMATRVDAPAQPGGVEQ